MTTSFQIPAVVNKFLNEVTRKHAPDASIRPKSESTLMKMVAWLVKPFNPDFMNSYITTIGTTIWVPDNWFETTDDTGALEVIAHETQHIIDLKKWGWIFFAGGYLFPQFLAIFAFLALLAIPLGLPWLFALLFLGFAGPVPAYFRYRFELNGYRTSYIFGKYVRNYTPTDMAAIVDPWVIDQLSNKWYYCAWPFPKAIKSTLDGSWDWAKQPRYQELLTWLLNNGLASNPQTSRLALHLAHRRYMKLHGAKKIN